MTPYLVCVLDAEGFPEGPRDLDFVMPAECWAAAVFAVDSYLVLEQIPYRAISGDKQQVLPPDLTDL